MLTPSRKGPARVVVKLGTGVLTSGVGRLDTGRIAAVCAQLAALRTSGTEVYVVSSGAIGLGMGRLALSRRPVETARKQACAAVGQSLLMETWQAGFAPHGVTVAQVLLTHEDLRARARYLAVRETLAQVIAYGAVPIINENDAVSAAEIKEVGRGFGDNDTLSAMVASLVGAQFLLILSTAPGLVDLGGSGRVVPVVERITPEIEAMAGGDLERDRRRRYGEQALGGKARDQVRLRRLHRERGRARHRAAAPRGHGPRDVLRPERAAARVEEALARFLPEALGRDPGERLRGSGPAGPWPEPPRGRGHRVPRRVRGGRRGRHRGA